MHNGSIAIRRQRHARRVRHKTSTVEHFTDFVHCNDDMRFAIAQHYANRIGARIRRPSDIAVVKIVEAQARNCKEALGDQLAERGHETKVWCPILDKHLVKFRSLDIATENRNAVFARHVRNPFFLNFGVDVPPQPNIGMSVWLLGIVGNNAGDSDKAGQRFAETLAENMVAAVEAAEDDGADFAFWCSE